MKDRQWQNWTEPLEVLLTRAKEFLETVNLSDFPKRGKFVEPPELYTRKKELANALAAFMDYVLIGNFLRHYVYTTSVYSDVYDFVFEYIGENEHQMDLHGDEFAQTKEALFEDFKLYLENWVVPMPTNKR